MKKHGAMILSFLTLCLLPALGQAQQQVTAGGLTLTAGPQVALPARAAGDPQLLQSARLYVYDGKARHELTLTKPAAHPVPGAVYGVTYQASPTLTVNLALQPVGHCVVWQVSCTNSGNQQLWLELGPELLLHPEGQFSVFDGWDDFAAPTKLISSTRMNGNMPLAAAWNQRAAVAVGLEPSQLVSYFRNQYEPLAGGAGRLDFLSRIVVDPGKTESLRFITCATPGEWGKFEVFQAYYNSFPSWFVANPHVDPRASGGSSMYRAWPCGPWSPEICRRLYGQWEWCYAPFRRTGDIVSREQFWNYKPARPFDKTRALPRDQYLKWRRQAFANGEQHCDVAMMFYIPSQVWCEVRLARSHYADALVTDPKVKTYFDTPWVTGQDNEVAVFPYDTSFGKQSRIDIKQVAQDLDLSGFAFDTAGGAARYTGPDLPRMEHRAWDHQVGVYCSEMVAIPLLMDYVHSLQKNGETLAVVANPMAYGSYSSCFHCDSAMLEANPWTGDRTNGDHLRWKMGHKTLVWWEGYELGNLVDPDTITRKQLTEVYRGLADYTLLQSLRLGYVPPPNYTQGMTRLVKWLPAMIECAQAGWQPVPAVRAPKPLWTSRFGNGLGTLVTVGHETGKPVSGELAVENQRLGEGALLFSQYNGQAVTNRMVQGETHFNLTVPVRTPVVLRSQLQVVPAGALRQAEVSATQGLSRGTLQATLQGSGEATFRLRVPPGMKVATVSYNDQPVKVTADRRGVPELRLRLGRQGRLTVAFASTLFASPDADLLNFPFVRDGKPACAIVIPAHPSETEKLMAFRIQEYFRYWYGRIQTPATDVVLPILENQPNGGRLVSLRVQPGLTPRVTVENGNLVVQAPNDEALQQATFKLLRALDTKYWTADKLPATVLNVRTGLANTAIEWPNE